MPSSISFSDQFKKSKKFHILNSIQQVTLFHRFLFFIIFIKEQRYELLRVEYKLIKDIGVFLIPLMGEPRPRLVMEVAQRSHRQLIVRLTLEQRGDWGTSLLQSGKYDL